LVSFPTKTLPLFRSELDYSSYVTIIIQVESRIAQFLTHTPKRL